MEDLINPLATALYEQYGFLNPAQLVLFSQTETQTAQASTQYQDAFTLDRLVGTTRAILRDAHYDKDIPILESILGNVFDDYKDVLISAGIHLGQVARTFQDYGQGRQVNLAGADIRSSSTLNTISSTTYVLETGAALLNAKQLLQQSAYTHVISDLYQLFSQCSFYRAEFETHQSNKFLIHANDYEVSAATVTEQAGNRILYADDLLITVGSKKGFNLNKDFALLTDLKALIDRFGGRQNIPEEEITAYIKAQAADFISGADIERLFKTLEEVPNILETLAKGKLTIAASKAGFDFDNWTVSAKNVSQSANQYTVHADRLNLSGGATTLYGSSANVGAAGLLRISGSPVMINGARVAAPGIIPLEVIERHKPSKFSEVPIYEKTSLLQTQSAGGIQMGSQEVVSPPQGTAGAYAGISPAGRISTSPITAPVYNRDENLPDESITRPTL
jgi:hypothetical protein